MKKFQRKAQSQPKHGHPSSSGASRAPPLLSNQLPGWKGPSYLKKVPKNTPATPSQSQKASAKIQDHVISSELQQLVLDLFQETFPASNDFDALKPALREIKEAINERDFERAFGSDEYKEKFTIRWGPSKILACSNVLARVCQEWPDEEVVQRIRGTPEQTPGNIVCFGRGVTGPMAAAVVRKQFDRGQLDDVASSPEPTVSDATQALEQTHISKDKLPQVNVWLIDEADWAAVSLKLYSSLTTPRPLSQFASAKARASNKAPISANDLSWHTSRLDVLNCNIHELSPLFNQPTLITLFFTLGELYTISISKASAFLQKLTMATPPGSLLLIIDETEFSVQSLIKDGEEIREKSFPLTWLFNKALNPPPKPTSDKKDTPATRSTPSWETLCAENSCLFELSKRLTFPVSLENTRFQMHLLKRI